MRKLGKKRVDNANTLQAYAICNCNFCVCKSCATSAVDALLDNGTQSQTYGTIYLLWN